MNPAATCAANNAVLQFSPGYYTNKAILTPASTVAGYTANGNACTLNYLYFQPGVYYFDFGFDPAFTSKIWNVAANQKVVGGEPNGWDPNVADSLPPVPGGGSAAACKTEANGGTTGVQFVFGGASQMTVSAASSTVELCADPTPVGTNQQIAIYGQQTGSRSDAGHERPPRRDGRGADSRRGVDEPADQRAADQPGNDVDRHPARLVHRSRRRIPRRARRSTSPAIRGFRPARST